MLYSLENVMKRRQREHGYRLLIRSLKIPRGARIAITGPSGCGKSTTLDLLGLSLQPDEGDLFTFTPANKQPVDILGLWQAKAQDSLADLRLRNMGYVLQSGELIPYLTVMENMTLTAKLCGLPNEQAKARAIGFGKELGIEHLFKAMPATLSVGERQRVAIVRALASQPELILADEPTAALDPLHAARVMEIFLEAIARTKSTLILVTHNIEWAIAGGLEELPFVLQEDESGVTAILDNSSQRAKL